MIKKELKLSPELESMGESIREIETDLLDIIKARIETELEKALRTLVVPVIKGEITKGKIRWRGLILVHDYWNGATHIMQRGKLITTVKTNYIHRLIPDCIPSIWV